ncbi:MAG: 4a-hydroxytetrahydrobiopterin dehydratase [Chloroflexi bacterium]|nr:4a-hydroxytetrahydrobiopterin dehydratase [Chloroflexota bacterium]
MALLTDAEVEENLKALPGWTRRGPAIAKKYRLPSFREAIAFVNRVADLAEAADHHPDMAINWRNVTISLITYSEGGLTEKDFNLAKQVEGAAISKE